MRSIPLAIIVCFLAAPVSALAQGALTPPAGAPAPSMKTLEQVEPRIDLQNAPEAAVDTSQAFYHYVINLPGSYYLSANVEVTKPHGIRIVAEGVTLDLNGFSVSRRSGSGGNGIDVAGAHAAVVENGSIKGFSFCARSTGEAQGTTWRKLAVSNCGSGIVAGDGAIVEACLAFDNSGSVGIGAGVGSRVSNCTARNNTTTYGISVGNGSLVTNCTATGNTSTYGILTGAGSTIAKCTAFENTGLGGISAGIATGVGTAVSDCTAYGQQTSQATLTPSTGAGFILGTGSSIKNSVARSNTGDGIQVSFFSHVRDNLSFGNGAGPGSGAGIHATNGDNRIEGNSVVGSDRGIDVDTGGNFIARNTASGNLVNWDVASGNVILVVQATNAGAVNGNSGGTEPGSSDPNANFTF